MSRRVGRRGGTAAGRASSADGRASAADGRASSADGVVDLTGGGTAGGPARRAVLRAALAVGTGTTLAALAGCSDGAEPSPTSPTTPDSADPATAHLRAPADGVFGTSSLWRADVRDAPLHPDSATLVAGLVAQVAAHYGGVAAFNAHDYANSFVIARPGTERADVVFDDCQDKGYTPEVLVDPGQGGHFLDVPVPQGAVPAPGDDGQLSVWDPDADRLWELWRARLVDGRWHACWGGRIDEVSTSRGYFPDGTGSAATGLAYSGGMVRLSEAAAGSVDHTMSLNLVDLESYDTFSYPAQRSDGYNPDGESGRIPEGLRLRLGAGVDVDALGLHPVGAAVARAAQRHGFVVTDKAGAVAVNAESGASLEAATGTDPWDAVLGGTSDHEVLAGFPWDRLEALPVDWGRP